MLWFAHQWKGGGGMMDWGRFSSMQSKCVCLNIEEKTAAPNNWATCNFKPFTCLLWYGLPYCGFEKKTSQSSKYYLKVVSATFLLVCFVCLKKSTCETRKNVFYFTSKALFILEIIKF